MKPMKLAFITHNKFKFEEVKELCSGKIDLIRTNEEYPEIQADSLEEVAIFGIKSLEIENVIVEDAGLFIDALNGFPGVYSSFIHRTIGNKGILKLMRDIKEREARFESVIAYRGKDKIHLFKGICRGKIAMEEKGKKGFGYDPIFIPEGSEKTFAQMQTTEKNKFSHRGKAVAKIMQFLGK